MKQADEAAQEAIYGPIHRRLFDEWFLWAN